MCQCFEIGSSYVAEACLKPKILLHWLLECMCHPHPAEPGERREGESAGAREQVEMGVPEGGRAQKGLTRKGPGGEQPRAGLTDLQDAFQAASVRGMPACMHTQTHAHKTHSHTNTHTHMHTDTAGRQAGMQTGMCALACNLSCPHHWQMPGRRHCLISSSCPSGASVTHQVVRWPPLLSLRASCFWSQLTSSNSF